MIGAAGSSVSQALLQRGQANLHVDHKPSTQSLTLHLLLFIRSQGESRLGRRVRKGMDLENLTIVQLGTDWKCPKQGCPWANSLTPR